MSPARRVLGACLAVAVATAACSADAGRSAAPSGAVPSTGAGPSATPVGSAGTGPPDGQFTNPVYDVPLADPFILEHDGTYYVYGTPLAPSELFETARSTDLVTWEELPSALEARAAWSPSKAWAPEVFRIGDRWVMYYTTSAPSVPNPFGDASQCISVAVGDDPAGPFVDESEEPLVCQGDLGGSIDATWFRDTDGTPYLIWKNDGNCCRIPTRFYLQEVSADGLELVGEAVELEGLRNERRWEDAVIEAPTLLERDGTYYMFFSGGFYASSGYAVGYATADDIRGPYTDSPDNPILETNPPAAGPGHQSIVADKDGDLWMAYHAWDAEAIGEDAGGQRRLWLDELVWEGDTPVVRGPDAGPQPVP